MSRWQRERHERQPAPLAREDRKIGGPVVPLIPVEDLAKLGPAMAALPNDAMRSFVRAKVLLGASNVTAARLAGYASGSPHALQVQSARIAHDERVQAAMLEEGRAVMRAHGAKSMRLLAQFRDDEDLDPKLRAKCAMSLLDRGGFHLVQEVHQHQHGDTRSEAEKDQRILELLTALGISKDEVAKAMIAPKVELAQLADGSYGAAEAPMADLVAEPPSPPMLERRAHRTPQRLRHEAAQERARERHAAKQDVRVRELAAELNLSEGDVARMLAAEPPEGVNAHE
jgi:hypothetical protein